MSSFICYWLNKLKYATSDLLDDHKAPDQLRLKTKFEPNLGNTKHL